MAISSLLRTFLLGTVLIFSSVFIPNTAFSQAFSIFNVDASGYPTIKAGFFVTNGNGVPVEGIPSDFRVFDNGVNVTSTVKVNCREAGQCDLSVALVLDKSGSMLEAISPGKTRWDAVKFGVNSFLNTIDFNGKNEVALTSFDGFGYLNADFKTTKQPIIDALNLINPANTTKYNDVLISALRDPINYRNVIVGDGAIGMLSRRQPSNCKVVLFLTDGLAAGDPTRVNEIVQQCQLNAIRFFSVSIGVDAIELKAIAAATGGRAFVVPTITEQSIKAVYDAIAAELKGTKVCDLEWQAPFGCTQASRTRLAAIRFNRAGLIDRTDTARYTAPDFSVAPIQPSKQVLSFGDVDANLSKTDFLTFTVPIDGYTITSIDELPENPQYEIVDIFVNGNARPKPFVFPFQLNKNDVLRVETKFTQSATKLFHQTELVVNGIPCSIKVPLVGGLQTVTVIKPDGGEILSTCDTFSIIWAGVDDSTKVNIQYSEVDPPVWKPLASGVSGLVYDWVPSIKGTKYLIRVILPPSSFYQWVKQINSSGPDTVSSIALNPNQDLLYSTGAFSNTVIFNGNTTLTSAGSKDIFMGQQNPISGNFNWVTKVSSPSEDIPSGILVDGNNVWVTGASYSTGSIGVSPLNYEVPNRLGVFLARLDPSTGSATITNTEISASSAWNQFEAYPEEIRIGLNNQGLKRIWVIGKYRNRLGASSLRNLPDATNWSTFTGTFSELGQLVLPLSAGIPANAANLNNRKSVQNTTDLDGNQFQSGIFTGTLESGLLSNTAVGAEDGYIRRFGGVPGNSDESTNSFVVDAPKLKTETPLVILDTVCIGEEITHVAKSTLCNDGTIPLTVTDVRFRTEAEVFTIVSSPNGKVILGELCEFFDIEISFKPNRVGKFIGVLVIEGTCTQPIEITYIVDVKDCCNMTAVPIYDFMNVDLNQSKQSVNITIKNDGLSLKSGEVKITPGSGNATSDFTIPPTGGGGGFLLPAGVSKTVTVVFTPSVSGLRTAELDWGFDKIDCGDQITSLIGNGVNIVNVTVDNIDFQRKRVETVNNLDVTLTNAGTSNMTLGSAVLQNQGNGTSFSANPTLPTGEIIQSGIPKPARVQFIPVSEGNLAASYTFNITGQPDPLIANIRGFGFLPKITTTWDCGVGAKIGDSVRNNLVISNPSTSSDLFIESISFANGIGGDFRFDIDLTTINSIAMGGNIIIPIVYAPTAGGASSVIVNVVSDASPGPDTAPRVTTAIPISCSSSGVVVNGIDFGSINGCDTKTQNLVINNQGSSAIVIVSATVTPTNSPFTFTVNNVNVNANGSVSIPVTFAPTSIGTFNSVITLNLSNGETVVVAVSGTSTKAPLTFTIPKVEYNITPGLNQVIPISVNFGNFGNTQINSLDVVVTFNPSIVNYKSNVATVNASWNFIADPQVFISNTEASITFKGSGPTPINTPSTTPLFDLTFQPLLGNAESSEFKVSGNFLSGICTQVAPSALANLKITNVCFLRGRAVTGSGFNYGLMSAFPNPANSSTTVDFSIAFDAHTSIELVNAYGEVVKRLVDTQLKAGEYSQIMDLRDLPTGYYTLRCLSGLLNASTPIVITR